MQTPTTSRRRANEVDEQQIDGWQDRCTIEAIVVKAAMQHDAFNAPTYALSF
jgi:hypothetical protein